MKKIKLEITSDAQQVFKNRAGKQSPRQKYLNK